MVLEARAVAQPTFDLTALSAFISRFAFGDELVAVVAAWKCQVKLETDANSDAYMKYFASDTVHAALASFNDNQSYQELLDHLVQKRDHDCDASEFFIKRGALTRLSKEFKIDEKKLFVDIAEWATKKDLRAEDPVKVAEDEAV